jgi:hypothetical protein
MGHDRAGKPRSNDTDPLHVPTLIGFVPNIRTAQDSIGIAAYLQPHVQPVGFIKIPLFSRWT